MDNYVLNVLIVEDRAGERNEYSTFVKSLGYNTDCAENAKTAFGLLLNKNYDAMLLDVGLPDIDGFEMLTEISQRRPNTKVIILTGEKRERDDVIRAMRFKVFDYVLKGIDTPDDITEALNRVKNERRNSMISQIPVEITDSITRFRNDHPDALKSAFVIMQFGDTLAHQRIINAIRDTLSVKGIEALRADDKQYHDDLFSNVLTYIYGCGFAVAIFERIEADDFNPNVSLEVGHMLVLSKPVCLLKDKTLKTLHTDLVGKLYKQFDPQSPETTIPEQLTKWMCDKGII